MGRRHSAGHAFVADLDRPVLDPADQHHLARVLRLRPGQSVTVTDGTGAWQSCRWTAAGGLVPDGEVVSEPAALPSLTVAFALTKGAKPEWAVQKLTELGVDRIVVFTAERSVVRWDAATAAGHLVRWRRVAREAAMQSRRVRLPRVDGVVRFADVAAELESVGALAEPDGGPPGLDRPALLVGPEGGWSGDELGCGLPTAGLGPGVLRAETAAVA
ncbi:MAG: RsmE family RNA methyltransferase, partial [Acidimicrobiales bacterium]